MWKKIHYLAYCAWRQANHTRIYHIVLKTQFNIEKIRVMLYAGREEIPPIYKHARFLHIEAKLTFITLYCVSGYTTIWAVSHKLFYNFGKFSLIRILGCSYKTSENVSNWFSISGDLRESGDLDLPLLFPLGTEILNWKFLRLLPNLNLFFFLCCLFNILCY